jgi:hypothetical protein
VSSGLVSFENDRTRTIAACHLGVSDGLTQRRWSHRTPLVLAIPSTGLRCSLYRATSLWLQSQPTWPPEQLSPVVIAHDSQANEVYSVNSTYVYWVAGPGFGDSKIYRVAK